MNRPDAGHVAPPSPPRRLLAAAHRAMSARLDHRPTGRLRVGIDLGTAYVVVMVTDEDGHPLVGVSRAASVVRDGVVVDFAGAVGLVRELVTEVEDRLGVGLETAATTFPPGVPVSEVRATRYVVEAAGLECTGLVDEPTAANAVLSLRDGAVVDIGGGTTGIAVLRDGAVIHVGDEATGGTHVTLVIAGALGLSFEDAEVHKLDHRAQRELLPVVRPVFDKIATIIARHIDPHRVETVHLVGGTSAFPGIVDVVAAGIEREVHLPPHPLLVTPLGVALHDVGDQARWSLGNSEVHDG
ncbi:ethanolamine utilization protein EutJ [Nitriliruptor alkaliphilus]|uniref:ethanolamine utilization protein EutJ n=1 Tax=Nitriliruptor alkaliphilus TaxID=427918 RepID=UPI001B806D4A|nr:ethanolamine utilization protein EutJ [Nitriliruptor alkaliphilus]